MDFLVQILAYLVKYVLMIGAALIGVFAGKSLRAARKNSKK